MLFIKGLIIGIGKIIPGVSGSLIAISLNEYERMVYSINNYFDDVVKNSKYLFKICLGILISIILFSNIIMRLINYYYIYTMFLFGGFILGSIIDIKKNTKGNYLFILVSLVLFLLINIFIFSNNLFFSKNFIYYTIGGFLEAFTMIIPGISGTAILISYGCYNDVIMATSSINLDILIPFMIGMIFGVIITIKLVALLFSKYNSKTYSCIFGISIATIVIMLIKGINIGGNIIIALLFFIIGYFISKKTIAILAIDKI